MSGKRLRSTLTPLVYRAVHLYWRFARALTVGVRAVVVDQDGRVFLVKHSYIDGWHLPGGGVEPGETLLEALTRELIEEANIELLAPPALHGIYFYPLYSRRDHVALYVVREFRRQARPASGLEIIDSGFFAPDALPANTTAGTTARIAEVLAGKPPTQRW